MSDRNVSPDSGQHWADEGAWPAAPGVHRIPLPLPTDGLRAVNVYAIETDGAEGGLTLVDGGWVKWVAEQRPFEHGRVTPKPGNFTIRMAGHTIISSVNAIMMTA